MAQTVLGIAFPVMTIAANVAISIADLKRAPMVLANSARVGVPESWLYPLAALKLAGAVGLGLGLLGFQPVGIAAGAGLVTFYAGACVAHVRMSVYDNIAFPGAFLALGVGSLIVMLVR